VRVATINGHALRDYRRLLRRGQTASRLDQATGTVDGADAVWARDPWDRRCGCSAAPEGCRCPELLGVAAHAATATARAVRAARDRPNHPWTTVHHGRVIHYGGPPNLLDRIPLWLIALATVAVIVAVDLIGR
jgi:hypothetical protein